jgi:hypothetical protein
MQKWFEWVSFAKKEVVAARVVVNRGGKEKSSLFPPLTFIPPLKCDGGVWVLVMFVPIPLLGYLKAGFLPYNSYL